MGNLIENAIIYATEMHSGSVRKGTSLPYIVHPIEACAIASSITDAPDVIAAAVLHDTLEDTDASEEKILSLFGSRVLQLVKAESEDKMRNIPAENSWKMRKEATLNHLK